MYILYIHILILAKVSVTRIPLPVYVYTIYTYIYTGKGSGVTAVNLWYYPIVPVSQRQTQSYGQILGTPIAAIFTITQLIVPHHTVCIRITETTVCISTWEDLYPHSRYLYHHLTPVCLHRSHGYKHTVVKHTPIAGITSECILYYTILYYTILYYTIL